MVDYEKEFEAPAYQARTGTLQIGAVFRQVYGWMAAGLAISGAVAWYVASSNLGYRILTGPGMIVCVLVELGLVLALASMLRRLSPFAALAMFLVYAAVNGLTLSVVFMAYELATVQRAFFIAAGMFAGLAVWGTVTRNDLSSIGSFCGMALWGLIVAGIVNMFLPSRSLDFICSFAGVLIFSGLTMYDAQKIKELAAREGQLDGTTVRKLGIAGALTLYLDFVNLFLHLLRFMGNRRD